MRLFPTRKSTEPRTEIDRIVNALWLACSLSLIPIFILALCHGLQYRPSIYALIALVMSIGTTATGFIVRSKVYTVAGLLGMAGTAALALWDFTLKQLARTQEVDCFMLNNEILIFAAIFVVMMVIPGHIINFQNRREEAEEK